MFKTRTLLLRSDTMYQINIKPISSDNKRQVQNNLFLCIFSKLDRTYIGIYIATHITQ